MTYIPRARACVYNIITYVCTNSLRRGFNFFLKRLTIRRDVTLYGPYAARKYMRMTMTNRIYLKARVMLCVIKNVMLTI